jgi:heat shock protein HslJ
MVRTMRTIVYGLAAVTLVGAAMNAQAQGIGRRTNQEQHNQGGGQRPPVKEEKRFPLGQSWIAVSLNGKPLGGSERPTFTLDEQFRVRGFGGCNTFSATAYPLREQGIAVGPIAMTKRSCDKGVSATEMQFLTALRTSAKWETIVGSLVLKSPNGELKFERSL